MDAEVLVALLGLASTDPRVEDALQRLGVARRPKLKIDSDDADGPVVESQDWVGNLSLGLEFGFQEEGAYMGLDQADRGIGPMLLTEVYFHGAGPGRRACAIPLPFGLSLADDRDTVRRKLSWPGVSRRSYLRDTWDLPAYRLTVSYTDDRRNIAFVVCMLRTVPPEPFEGVTGPLPDIPTLIRLLGRRMDDAELRQVFVPLGLDRVDHSGANGQSLDFRRTHGFRLGCDGAPVRRLRSVEMLRAGEFESRGWRGDLPFGITFDDSPEVAVEKVGLAPAHRQDEDFSGQAFWTLPDCALLVVYSTMENLVLRVQLLPPEA